MNKTITIIGPTASGKSDIAIKLAKDFNGEIISADSRQIYKKLDIGSGKEIGKIELSKKRGKITQKAYISNNIPHYMIDILHPNTKYNVSKFVKKSKQIRNDIWKRGKNPIIAGGTMFWAQALIENSVFPSVPPNYTLRNELNKKTPDELLEILKKKDKTRASEIVNKNEINNKVRLIRALEIVDTLGYIPRQNEAKKNFKNDLIVAVSLERDVLYKRLEKRMNKWFEEGIFEEINMLHSDMNVPWSRLESFGLEYKWCTKYVRNQISFAEMEQNTLRDLKKYTKRQLTWIKRWEKNSSNILHIKNYEELKLKADFFY